MTSKEYNTIAKISPIYGLISIIFGIFIIRVALAYKITSASYLLIVLGLSTIFLGTIILVLNNRKK